MINDDDRQIKISDITASKVSGEMHLQTMPQVDQLATGNGTGLLHFLWHSFKGLLRNSKSIFRKPMLLIAIVLITFMWLVLYVLNATSLNFQVVKILNMLTFAEGGATGGTLSMLGGIVGKGLLTYLFITTVMRLLGNKNIPPVMGGSKRVFTALKARDLNSISLFLMGGGSSLIAYNFMAGDISSMSSMVPLTGLLLTLRTLNSHRGFLRGLIQAVFYQFTKGKLDIAKVNKLIVGIAAGFSLSLPLSFVTEGSIGYILGSILVVIAFVMIFLLQKKEVPTT